MFCTLLLVVPRLPKSTGSEGGDFTTGTLNKGGTISATSLNAPFGVALDSNGGFMLPTVATIVFYIMFKNLTMYFLSQPLSQYYLYIQTLYFIIKTSMKIK